MELIQVSKDRLLQTLKTNRDEHRSLFEKAQVVYREEVIKVLDQRLTDAKEGRKISTFISLKEPVDYTESFDEAISMVEWAEGTSIELTDTDFRRYVLNKWEWANQFAAATMSYVR